MNSRLISLYFVLSSHFLVSPLFAECSFPAAPTIPDGATATQEEMTAGMRSTKAYGDAVSTYLACIDSSPDTKPEFKNKLHNWAVGELEAQTEKFNTQVQVFKSRTATVVQATANSTPAVTPGGLAPHVQADLLKREIVSAYRSGNEKNVLPMIDRYRALEKQGGVVMPLPLVFVEAKCAAAVRDTARALQSLKAYLNSAPPSDHAYQEALALYPEYEKAAQSR